jgi:16S rRNA (uracil1498-N3)-methyltransferase
LLVGPEGGFTAEELQTLARLDFVRFVSLGDSVLRAETAAIAALAVLGVAEHPA